MKEKEYLEYNETGEFSTVRTNLMNQEGYAGYCGNSWDEQKKKNCDMPRTRWAPEIGQFKCPKCGWISQYPKEFIDKYKLKWNK
jgi:hypothetical protein